MVNKTKKMRDTKYRFILRVSEIGIKSSYSEYHEEIITRYFTLRELVAGKFINLYRYNTIKIIGISQFTGILDTADKEIYEDDIILNWTVIWLIKWGDEEIDYCGYVAERISDEWHELFINHNWRNGKVIGNKYINPELLIKKRKRDNLG